MKMTGEYAIPASRENVWEALNDPEVLKACIPGCEALERTGENAFEATVTVKIGPVKSKFKGQVELTNLNPPQSYELTGAGSGGAAGGARGSAKVHLASTEAGTTLTYEADAQVNGKLAQLGQRMIDPVAKKLANQFFSAFSERLGGAETPAPAPAAAPAGEPTGLPQWVWLAGVVALLAFLVYIFL